MKKAFIISAMALILAFGAAVQAKDYKMTDEKYDRFMKTDADFKNANDNLNAVWKQIKGKLGKEEFDRLLKEQRAWIRQQGRLAGEISGVSEVEAFTIVTRRRIKELDKVLAANGGARQEVPARKSAPGSHAAGKKTCGVFGSKYSENGRFLAYELVDGETRVFISGFDQKALDQIDGQGIEIGDKVCAEGTIRDGAYDMERAFTLVKQP
ncbi:MAG: DUF1311 domain-containing protein [Clostridia bacterium]|nr:DUF1311 domain-containing protein [Clostridia bacterium]